MAFEYSEFANEPIYPLQNQTAIHLHDRNGLGTPLVADNGQQTVPDLNYSPGSWNYSMDGRDGLDGLQGLRGKTGPAGLKGAPGKSTGGGVVNKMLLALKEDGVIDRVEKNAIAPYFSLGGVLRFESGTLLEEVDWPNFTTVTFPTSDPGGGKIWLSAT